jgi:hypothetical protein
MLQRTLTPAQLRFAAHCATTLLSLYAHRHCFTADTIGTTLCASDTVTLFTGVLLDTLARSHCVQRNALKNCTSVELLTIGILFHNSTNSHFSVLYCSLLVAAAVAAAVLPCVCTYTVSAALLDHTTATTVDCSYNTSHTPYKS